MAFNLKYQWLINKNRVCNRNRKMQPLDYNNTNVIHGNYIAGAGDKGTAYLWCPYCEQKPSFGHVYYVLIGNQVLQ